MSSNSIKKIAVIGPESAGKSMLCETLSAHFQTICFPGGHVEPGEDEHQAVVRECHEELAAIVEARECVWRSMTSWGTELAWWTVTLRGDNELVPHPVEVSEILWLSAREMMEHPDVLEGNRPFLEAVMAGRIPV